MSQGIHRRYHFSHASHWSTGGLKQLEVAPNGLVAPDGYNEVEIGNTEHTGLLYCDDNAKLYHLNKKTKVLSCQKIDESATLMTADSDVTLQIVLTSDQDHIEELVVGPYHLWVRTTEQGLIRFDKTSGAVLSGVSLHPENRSANVKALSICGDAKGGLWVVWSDLELKETLLVHYQVGDFAQSQCVLDKYMVSADLAISSDGLSVFILGAFDLVDIDLENNPEKIAWHIWEFDTHCRVFLTLYTQPIENYCVVDALDSCDCVDETTSNPAPPKSTFAPTHLIAEPDNRLHVLDLVAASVWHLGIVRDCPKTEYFANLIGRTQLQSRVNNVLADACFYLGHVTLSWKTSIDRLVAGRFAKPGSSVDVPSYITPQLNSPPEGGLSGWMRADLEVDIDLSATIEISVASTDDAHIIEQAQGIIQGPFRGTESAYCQLEQLLPWQNARTVRYLGADWQNQAVRFPLHEIKEDVLWLRIRVFPALEGKATRLKELTVTYPNISYTRFLPAIFNNETESSRLLRNFIVPLESILGDFNETIQALPTQIDPETAPLEWIPFLLKWLGLPPAMELEPHHQRQFLRAAPVLLNERGTLHGLKRLMNLVVGPELIPDAIGEGATPWVLSDNPLLQNQSTHLVYQKIASDNKTDAFIGQEGFGFHIEEVPVEALDNKALAAEIRITVFTEEEKQPRLEPLFNRFLPYFIPVQCRYTLGFIHLSEPRRRKHTGSEALAPIFELRSDGVRLGNYTIGTERRLP